MHPDADKFIQQAIRLSKQGMDSNAGGPFGAVVVKDGQAVATGINKVTSTNDPTAHAEIIAIKDACKKLGNYDLTGCVIYASCEPCPMCLGAIYWARLDAVYYANTKSDAADIGFDDSYIYQELAKPLPRRAIRFVRLARDEAQDVFEAWKNKPDKQSY